MNKQVNLNLDDFMTGSLLGDGHLFNHDRNNKALFTQSCKSHNYLKWKQEFLERLNIKSKISKTFSFDKRYNKKRRLFILYTKKSLFFGELLKEWYINKKKIIPKNTKLTLGSLIIWFCEDGTYSKISGITFCTECFTKEEVSYLINQLSDFNLKGRLYKRNKTSFRIGLDANSSRLFIKLIRTLLPQPFVYKIRNYKEPNLFCEKCNYFDINPKSFTNHYRSHKGDEK